MKQGSPEWHEVRRNRIGASDAPVIMGVSPWKTVGQLWKEKLGLVGPGKETGPMLDGRQKESQALSSFIQQTGIQMAPAVEFHPTIPYMMASLDGLTEDKKQALEIKCPGKKDHDLALLGLIPDKYYPQLQHQIEVLSLDEIFYYSYNRKTTALIIVKRDQEYIDIMLEKQSEFWKCVQEYIEIE